MSDENRMIPVPVGPKGVELKDIDQMFRFASCYLQSGLAPTSIKNAQQLVIIWSYAAELGLTPMQALSGIMVIGNKTGLMGDLALSMVRSSGLLAKCEKKYEGKGPARVCHVTLQRKGEDEHTYSFSLEDAKTAKLIERNINYTHYPDRMLYYRALGFALRDEFGDVLKGMKIAEEVMDYHAELDEDEEKIRANQQATDKAKAEGVKFVEPSGGARPTPAQAVEPAFPEEAAKPDEPAFASRLHQEYGQQAEPVTNATAPSPADEIDMTPSAEPKKEPEQKPEPPWREHVILSIKKHPKFEGKKVGDLGVLELQAIEAQWMPKVEADWDNATDAQQLDYQMFAAAIAFSKMEKPWLKT